MNINIGAIAQLVEQLPLKETVVGSNPTWGTKIALNREAVCK